MFTYNCLGLQDPYLNKFDKSKSFAYVKLSCVSIYNRLGLSLSVSDSSPSTSIFTHVRNDAKNNIKLLNHPHKVAALFSQ